MEIDPPDPIVSVRELLPRLGFVEDWGYAFTDNAPAFQFKSANLELTASEVMTRFLRPCFAVGGIGNDGRTMTHVECELPLHVESEDQLKAWLAYEVGPQFRPMRPIPWLTEGRELQHTLPWEQKFARLRAEAAAREKVRDARPHCIVEREWLRPMCRRIAEAAVKLGPDGRFRIGFDGAVLKVTMAGSLYCAPASGPAPWPREFEGSALSWERIPRRFKMDKVAVGVWEGFLELDDRRLPPALDTGEAVTSELDGAVVQDRAT